MGFAVTVDDPTGCRGYIPRDGELGIVRMAEVRSL